MSQAKSGDEVSVHYKGTLDDGSVFDQSHPEQPLKFKLGSKQVISGFEKAVEGMAIGDSKTFTIAAGEAYGERRDDLVLEVNRDRVPPDVDPKIGQRYEMEKESGEKFRVTVTNVTEELVTLDANHPLAGKDLTFDIELVGIQE
jgi:peptidylprolyl isomerase